MAHSNHISLDGVLEEPVSFAFELPLTLATLDREPLQEISPVILEGTVSPIDGGYSLDARCAFQGKLECSRCLAGYPFAVDETFSLLLYPRAAGALGPGRDEPDVVEYEDGRLAVEPIAEERVQLAIPMKPLCRRECLGLCPRCGADRNEGFCGCQEEVADPRWGALEAFRDATKPQKV